MQQADSIWTGGVFLTMDPDRPVVSALASRDGRLLAAGDDGDIEALAGPGARHVRLHGRFAMPGLIESHTHALWGACRELYEVYTGYEAPLDALLQAVASRAADTEPGGWITGGPWFAAMRPQMGDDPRALLDRVAPDHKVALGDNTRHSGWCNSAALAAAGIDATTRPLPGGVIERLADGRPNGILHESAMAPIKRLTAPTPAMLARAADTANAYFNRLGYTAFKEPMAAEADLAAYAAADRAGRLTLHMAAHISCSSPLGPEPLSMDEMQRLRTTYATDNLRTGFAKLFLDGVAPSYTASFLEPYASPGLDRAAHDPDATLLIAPEVAAGLVSDLDRLGFTVKMHAVGDNAVRKGLDAIAAARAANGASGLRHEIAHSTFVDAADLERFAALGAVAEVSPKLWMPNAATPIQRAVLGDERVERCHPVRSLLDAGAEVIFGTDWPASAPDADPWSGLAGLLTRRDCHGVYPGVLGADQAISLTRALPLFTVNAARALRMEGETGQLRDGAWADFIVLDRDLRTTPAEAIASVTVEETVWKGQTVFAV